MCNEGRSKGIAVDGALSLLRDLSDLSRLVPSIGKNREAETPKHARVQIAETSQQRVTA